MLERGGVAGEDLAPGAGGGESAPAPAPVAAAAQLRRVDDMKTAFLSAVSHELRTPLTSVIGFAETTARLLEDEELELELDELLEDEEEPWEPPAPPPTFGSSPMLTGGSSGGAAAAPFVPNPRSGSWGARFLIMRLSPAWSRGV